jgi:hypothetical protein
MFPKQWGELGLQLFELCCHVIVVPVSSSSSGRCEQLLESEDHFIPIQRIVHRAIASWSGDKHPLLETPPFPSGPMSTLPTLSLTHRTTSVWTHDLLLLVL